MGAGFRADALGGAVTAACPMCGCKELLVVGTRHQVRFVRRWPRPWLRIGRVELVAVDSGCTECFCAFTARASGTTLAPKQQAHEMKVVEGKGRKASEDEKPVARAAMPRPAPDPRNRKR